MKRQLTLLLAAFFFLASGATAAPKSKAGPEVYSSGWLAQGCASVMVADLDPENWTKEQEKKSLATMHWLNGFMVGMNSSCFLMENSDPLCFPPVDWLDSSKLAPQILAFIKENRIAETVKAREVMLAFYYSKHPKATERQRNMGIFLLEKKQCPPPRTHVGNSDSRAPQILSVHHSENDFDSREIPQNVGRGRSPLSEKDHFFSLSSGEIFCPLLSFTSD